MFPHSVHRHIDTLEPNYPTVTPHSRSSSLRTYAGDTSLPGGKVDPDDNTIEDTAVSRAMWLPCKYFDFLIVFNLAT
jgi:8-oxo-dGTP pyrophosphatase MutT (NUDIX family)